TACARPFSRSGTPRRTRGARPWPSPPRACAPAPNGRPSSPGGAARGSGCTPPCTPTRRARGRGVATRRYVASATTSRRPPPRRVVHPDAVELAEQDLLDFQAVRSGEPVAWQVHQAGDETAVRVLAQEQAQLPASGEAQHAITHRYRSSVAIWNSSSRGYVSR